MCVVCNVWVEVTPLSENLVIKTVPLTLPQTPSSHFSWYPSELGMCHFLFTHLNPFMLTAAKTGLTILEIFF